ncbi:MAG: peptidoglycan editing factor PgeF, partial [Lachnospiraceae bacterium]|nr:peptidoglycan editing factor PgeF [Lachnospiraceae bacterium]
MNNLSIKYTNDKIETTVKYGINNVPYISIDRLEKTGIVINGFSTRLGGVSTDHLSSMNLGYKRGDNPDNVTKNHKLIADAIGFDYKRLVTSDQTHTTNVLVVTSKDCGKGITIPRDYSDIDGLITNESNVPLVTYFADCVPLYFVDPVKKVIGLSHSGWRGTVGKIGKKTIETMTAHFGSNPADMIVCIGPSICCKCYEVDLDVAKEFMNAFPDSYEQMLKEKQDGKYQLDLWKANEQVFLEAGVKTDNIVVTGICTCDN